MADFNGESINIVRDVDISFPLGFYSASGITIKTGFSTGASMNLASVDNGGGSATRPTNGQIYPRGQ